MRRNGGKSRRFSAFRDGGLFLATVFLGILIAAKLDQINSETYSGRFFVIDGDTLSKGEERFRLLGIDAPELAQTCLRGSENWPCGEEARRVLQRLAQPADFSCSGSSRDRYGRLLVYCSADGRDVSSEMVSAGFAVASGYFQFSSEQSAARREARGIWAGEFEKPSQWRREHRAADLETPPAGFLTIIRHLLGWDHG
ncbi:thermonuclease family protein [Agrobacterium tumefaciens]|uniref:thermonuclease family protein n=1 Tax=Agrobacterium tumefaciens TaxID=358 RepID=UPI000FC066C0|nr:thermonuclease family protein [Agrobacterium tumefaciens]UXS24416.1 thermonuclease family protein [Agrobacterium tumefaciens]UXS52631.1 thermonuclease family protein [Agrobacterium tumefaciens]UXS62877.1 thermonuclease family protein [Agrobacterium tumefaciens]